jgi:DNA-binding transcriptional LysR family regulator
MDLTELRVFLAVAIERSFSRAASKLHRTQPAISQAIRRLEDEVGERLFDRSSKDGTLTEAGRVLKEYAERILRLTEEAETSVRELRDLHRGRVLIGVNEAAVHILLPLIDRFRADHPAVMLDVRRVAARHVAVEVAQGTLDFGVLTFQPPERGLQALTIGADEMVLLVHPDHPLAGRSKVTLAEFGQQTVVAHSDPSPARERVLRVSEVRHAPINIQIALPSLEAIKRAVELRMGVALLPRRCALTEIARGTLVAVRVPEVRLPRQVRLVYRRRGELSHAATAFLEMVRQVSAQTDKTEMPTEQVSRPAQKPSIARAASAFQPS